MPRPPPAGTGGPQLPRCSPGCRRRLTPAAGLQEGGQLRQRRRDHPVVDPGATPLAVHQPGLAQHAEVVGDRGLLNVERAQQVAHADLASALTLTLEGDQRQQPQPHRITQGLEHPRQLRRGLLVQRLPDQRRAALTEHWESGPLFRHASILTALEAAWQGAASTVIESLERKLSCPVFSSHCASPTSKSRSSSTRSCSTPSRPSAAPATPTSPSPSPRSSSSSSRARPGRRPGWTTSASRSPAPPTSRKRPTASRPPGWPPSRRTTPPAATRCRTRSGSPAPARSPGRCTSSRPIPTTSS